MENNMNLDITTAIWSILYFYRNTQAGFTGEDTQGTSAVSLPAEQTDHINRHEEISNGTAVVSITRHTFTVEQFLVSVHVV